MDEARDILIQINEAHSLYLQYCYNYWIKYSLYTWQWWALIFILIAPWYLWWLKVDKKRMVEISLYGFVTLFFVVASDAIGVSYNLWIYPIRLAPKLPHILPIDTSVLPIIFMLIYQYYSTWKDFLIASAVMALVLAFIGEPFAVRLGVYELMNWKYYYSLPLYVVYPIVFKFIIETIKSIQGGSLIDKKKEQDQVLEQQIQDFKQQLEKKSNSELKEISVQLESVERAVLLEKIENELTLIKDVITKPSDAVTSTNTSEEISIDKPKNKLPDNRES